MPIMLPMLPPMIATINRVDSGIRHKFFLALYLSSPIKNKPARFTATKYVSNRVITSIYELLWLIIAFGNSPCASFGCGRGFPKAIFIQLVFLAFRFLHFHSTDFAGEAEQIDEALRIVMVIQISGSEGGDAFII